MELRNIHINDTSDRQYVTLAEKDGTRTLTIVIGWNEVQAIDRLVKGARPPRPLTHELLLTVFETAGLTLERVDVTELKEGTFFARLQVRKLDGTPGEIDARPSDALALAVALQKPIFVEETVIAAAQEEA
jgi:bifunctional DNase/RNase